MEEAMGAIFLSELFCVASEKVRRKLNVGQCNNDHSRQLVDKAHAQ